MEALIRGLLDGDFLILEKNLGTRAARAGEKTQLGDGNIILLQDFPHFLTDSAGGAKNRNNILFHEKNLLLFE